MVLSKEAIQFGKRIRKQSTRFSKEDYEVGYNPVRVHERKKNEKSKVCIVYHKDMLKHRPNKLNCDRETPDFAKEEDVLRVHDLGYL